MNGSGNGRSNFRGPLDPHLNSRIVDFGKGIFADLGGTRPSTFNAKYWNGRLMQWAMDRPEFKVNLFRLVDVLPTLKSNAAIAEHVREYLADDLQNLHPALGWGLGLSRNTMGAALASFFVKQGVQQMASLFIAGKDAHDAIGSLQQIRRSGFAFTVDLLGEFCVCEKEALAYLDRYLDAVEVMARHVNAWSEAAPLVAHHPADASPLCISVKLTALYSQTNVLNFERSVGVLSERLTHIVRKVKAARGQVYVDAEDSGNNDIIFETFRRVFSSPEFKDLPYPGMVVQAYAKNSEERIDQLFALARQRRSPIAIRLVKGAYWDVEQVICRQNHWTFPLWSKKETTDAHYEYLSRKLLDHTELCLPAFGSHNIRSLSQAICYAEQRKVSPQQFEIQVLYGMAEPIAQAFARRGFLVRMYVPLGELLPGMGYLVRRLLENTSNESFLRHTFFDSAEVATLLREPLIQSVDL